MPINERELHRLAIVTTVYTGVMLTQDREGVENYLSKIMGRNMKMGEWGNNKEDIREKSKTDLFRLWGLDEGEKVYVPPVEEEDNSPDIQDTFERTYTLTEELDLALQQWATEHELTKSEALVKILEEKLLMGVIITP